MPNVPSPDEIRTTDSKKRPLPLDPWVAAGFSRLWQAMKKHIELTTASDSSVTSSSADTQAQPRNDQSAPASSRNRS